MYDGVRIKGLSFFVNKIEELKKNIDPNLVEGPLARLKEKMGSLPTKLEFKPISQKKIFAKNLPV